MDSDLEKLLQEYVDPVGRERWQRDLQGTVAKLFNQAMSTDRKVSEGFSAIQLDLVLIKKEQLILNTRVEALEERDEITEVQQRDKLLGKLKEERDKTVWWQRWVLGIAATLIVALIASGTALVIQSLRQPPPVPARMLKSSVSGGDSFHAHLGSL